MTRLAGFVVRRRKAMLVVTLFLLVVGVPLALGASGRLDSGNLVNPPSSEASQAKRILAEQFGSGEPNLVLLVKARRGTVDSAAVAEEGAALTARVTSLVGVPGSSYWTLGSPPALRSMDATQALVFGHLPGADNEVADQIRRVAPLLERYDDVVDVTVTGTAQVEHESFAIGREDALRAELIAVPVLLLLLLIVFGSVVAAAMPLAVAALTVVWSYVALRLVARGTFVHVDILNLVTILGLGLAVDYSLFIVSRFREELDAGREPHDAVVRTIQTAGPTVLVSAAAVALSTGALALFPAHMNSVALVSVTAVIAGLGAVIVLPALLAVLGPNVNRLRVFHRATPEGQGFWHRMATTVMRRPVTIAAASIIFLLLLGAPFLRAQFSMPDERALPERATSRQALEEIRRQFPANEASALSVVAPNAGDPGGRREQITSYARQLSALPGVARVEAFTGAFSGGQDVTSETPASRQRFGDPTGRGTWLSVIPTTGFEPLSPAGKALVGQVRRAPAPFPVKVGGQSAQAVDTTNATLGRVPWVLALIAVVTLIILFLMFGSVLVPIKALVLNIFSLSATFGAMVWVFQEGHGAGLLHFTPTPLDMFVVILMFCVAFGLSMDYEVFLLSRIKEEHDRGADNVSAVATGLERTGRIVTAAAACLAVVFISTALVSSITLNKLFGLGMFLAVLMDATIIRGLLVPAFMRLAGTANWWAPRPLQRLHQRVGFHKAPRDVVAGDALGQYSIDLALDTTQDRTDSHIGSRANGGVRPEARVGEAPHGTDADL